MFLGLCLKKFCYVKSHYFLSVALSSKGNQIRKSITVNFPPTIEAVVPPI